MQRDEDNAAAPWSRVEHLCAALDSAEVGLWDLDLRTRAFWCSRGFEYLHGNRDVGSVSEHALAVRGRRMPVGSYLPRVHQPDRDKLAKRFCDAVNSTELVWQCDYRVDWPDKSVHWLCLTGHIERDADGTGVRITGVSTDITKKVEVQAENQELLAQLAEQSLSLQDIVSQLPAGIVIIEAPSGRVLIGDGRAREIFAHETMTGVNSPFQATIQDGKLLSNRTVEFKPCASDASKTRILELNAVPIRNAQGVIVAAIVSYMDCTVKKRIEADLQKSKSRFEAVARCTSHVVWEWDLRTRLVWRNENARICFGAGEDEDIHSYDWWYSRLHPDERDKVTSNVAKILDSPGGLFQQEYRLRRSDGTYATVEDKSSVTFDENGKPFLMTGAMADISARKEVEDQLRLARQAADTANLAKSQFLANVSHEIRTPLGVIMGFADFILDPEQSRSDCSLSAQTIKRNSEQLLELIDELLDLSKIEADRIEIEVVSFSLQNLLKDICTLMGFKAHEKGIRLNFIHAASMPDYIETDPTRLRQILINVIGNAIKFTETGEVQIEIKAWHDRNESDQSIVAFMVRDTGVGLSREARGKIFEPFVQADNSTTRKYGGTGLGLALSRRLARLLGGDVTLAESSPGEGSTFVVTILARTTSKVELHTPFDTFGCDTASDVQISESHFAGTLQETRILLVEDSPDNQILVGRRLASAGARVEFAANGEDGIRLAQIGDFDVVLMDIQMPGVDGYEATRRLRRLGFKKPIIALTAHAHSQDRERSIAAGCDEHLTKPINFLRLLKILQNYTQKSPRIMSEEKSNDSGFESLH